MTELFSFQGARDRTLCPAVSAAWEIVPSLTSHREGANCYLKKENSSKVLQKHSHSLDSLMNRNPFGFQGTCNLGLGVPGIDIERKDFEIKFR